MSIESLDRLKARKVNRPTTVPPHSPAPDPAPAPTPVSTATATPPTDFFDALFGHQVEAAQKAGAELDLRQIPLADLHEFKGHIFTVKEDQSMELLTESIRVNGQMTPAIVRARPEGGYEVISGHRRKRACQLAGKDTLRCLVVKMDDEAAERAMMESNLYRPFIEPSVRAKIYAREGALYQRQQGRRTDLEDTWATGLPKCRWRDEVGKKWGVSGEMVRQYLSLLKLIPELLRAVDETAATTSADGPAPALELSVKAGVALSALPVPAQTALMGFLEEKQAGKVSVAQAEALKLCFGETGELRAETMAEIFGLAVKEKKPRSTSFSLPAEHLHAAAKKYRKDEALQALIISTINRYIDQAEAAR